MGWQAALLPYALCCLCSLSTFFFLFFFLSGFGPHLECSELSLVVLSDPVGLGTALELAACKASAHPFLTPLVDLRLLSPSTGRTLGAGTRRPWAVHPTAREPDPSFPASPHRHHGHQAQLFFLGRLLAPSWPFQPSPHSFS